MSVQHAPTPLNNDPLLTAQEVCEILRVNLKTLYRRRHDGQLPGIPINGKRYLYRRSAVEHFLAMAEAGVFKTPTEPPPLKNRSTEHSPSGKKSAKPEVRAKASQPRPVIIPPHKRKKKEVAAK